MLKFRTLQRDFTINVYRDLLRALIQAGFSFQTYRDYIENPKEKVIILRHDVDDRKYHSFLFAQIQRELGITGTYYFRVVPQSYDPQLMKDIASMGHEVGLHYEEMDLARGDLNKAYQLFLDHLKMFRTVVEVKTICMHGSPKSRFDNKAIWKENDYRSLGIIGEPYFDLNTEEVYYLTDTGMMWDGHRFSVRDKMANSRFPLTFHTTEEIILAIREGKFPKKCMMNFHPQRWHSGLAGWLLEKSSQALKNRVKGLILFFRSKF